MRVDEIRRLADRVETDYATAVGKYERICPAIIAALLDFAGVVERCEEKVLFAKRIGGLYKHSQSNVLDMLDYILKGAIGERK